MITKRTLTVVALVCCVLMPLLGGCGTAPAPSLADYQRDRNALFARLRRAELGGNIHLSEAERLVDTKLSAMKIEARALWGDRPINAHSFLVLRERLAASDLYAFMRTMPKGAIQHVHPSALGDYRRLIRMATYREDCYVNVSRSPAAGTLDFFGAAPDENWVNCVRGRAASGDPDRYDAQLLDGLIMTPNELADHTQRRPQFEAVFARLGVLAHDRALYEKYIIESLRYLRDVENVRHVEMRAYWRDAERIDSWRRILNALNAETPRMSISLVACELRRPRDVPPSLHSKHIADLMLRLGRLRAENPDLIVGFDLYGEEDHGWNEAFFVPAILEARMHMAENDWDLPLYLHAGETNRPAANAPEPADFEADDAGAFNDNLVDAILLGSRRIGHGAGLAERPALWELCRQRGITVELNPASNMVLGYSEDLRDHVGASLIAAGVPVSINPDAPAIFGYEGAAYDYLLAAIAWNLDLAALKAISLESLNSSALTDAEKTAALADWREMWDMFILDQLTGGNSPAASEAEIKAAAGRYMKAARGGQAQGD